MTRDLFDSQWYSSNFCRTKDDVVTPETCVVVDNFERKQFYKKKIFSRESQKINIIIPILKTALDLKSHFQVS